MSEQKWMALNEMSKTKWGYLKDLRETYGSRMVEEFKKGGLINFGYSRTGKTWRLSNYGQMYVEEMKMCLS